MINNRYTQIFIEEESMLKMQYYSELATDEVGGLMEIENCKDKIIIKDIILLEQEASRGDFELTEEALGKFTENLFVNNPKKMKKIKGWWHKHPVLNWSACDNDTFKKLRTYFKGFVLGVVMQDVHVKPNKYTPLVRLDVGKSQFIQFNTPYLRLIKSKKVINKKDLRKKCKKEIKKYVKESYKTYNNCGNGYNGYGYNHNNNISMRKHSHPQEFNNEPNYEWDNTLQTWVRKPFQQTQLRKEYIYDEELDYLDDIGYPLGNPKKDLVKIDGAIYNLKEVLGCVWERDCHKCPTNTSCMKQLKRVVELIDNEENKEKDYLEEHFK